MNPVSAFGRLVGQAWELWLDKAEAGTAGHASQSSGTVGNCESAYISVAWHRADHCKGRSTHAKTLSCSGDDASVDSLFARRCCPRGTLFTSRQVDELQHAIDCDVRQQERRIPWREVGRFQWQMVVLRETHSGAELHRKDLRYSSLGFHR